MKKNPKNQKKGRKSIILLNQSLFLGLVLGLYLERLVDRIFNSITHMCCVSRDGSARSILRRRKTLLNFVLVAMIMTAKVWSDADKSMLICNIRYTIFSAYFLFVFLSFFYSPSGPVLCISQIGDVKFIFSLFFSNLRPYITIKTVKLKEVRCSITCLAHINIVWFYKFIKKLCLSSCSDRILRSLCCASRMGDGRSGGACSHGTFSVWKHTSSKTFISLKLRNLILLLLVIVLHVADGPLVCV